MKNSQLKRLAIAASAVLALALTGCGYNNANTVDPYGGYTDPYSTGGYGTGGGYTSDPYGGSTGGYGGSTGSYGGSTGSYGGSTGSYGGGYGSGYGNTTQAGYAGGELTARVLNQKREGFLFWKKVHATIQIKNNTPGVLTGDVTISFTKGGKVVDTQTEFITDLGPGQTHTFDKTARKTSDSVEVSVVTQAPSSQVNNNPNGYGSNYGSGSSYGSGTSGGYGSDPYGSSYGGSTGSTYGGGTGSTYGGGTGGYGY